MSSAIVAQLMRIATATPSAMGSNGEHFVEQAAQQPHDEHHADRAAGETDAIHPAPCRSTSPAIARGREPSAMRRPNSHARAAAMLANIA